MQSVAVETKKRIALGDSPAQIKRYLLEQGFNEKEINSCFKEFHIYVEQETSPEYYPFVAKQFSDKLSYGFGSQQYLNIFFYLIGSPLFFIALLNGAKVFLSGVMSSVMNTYAANYNPSVRMLRTSGLLFAFSFFLIVAAVFVRSIVLFAVALIIGSFTALTYEDSYFHLARRLLSRKRRLLSILAKYGVLLTAFALLIAAFIMDSSKRYGYMVIFGLTGIFLIISSLLLTKIVPKQQMKERHRFAKALALTFAATKDYYKIFFENRILITMIIAGSITSLISTLGHTFYGIFIYTKMQNVGFGGFMNVSVIFGIAVLSAIFVPAVARSNAALYGKFPMLIFGTLLMAITPLSFYYKPSLISLSLGTILGIIGAGIVGTAQGLITLDLVKEEDRLKFFQFSGSATVASYIIGIPIGSLLVYLFGMQKLFLMLSLGLVVLATPMYLNILLRYQKSENV